MITKLRELVAKWRRQVEATTAACGIGDGPEQGTQEAGWIEAKQEDADDLESALAQLPEPAADTAKPAERVCEWYGKLQGEHNYVDTADGGKRCIKCRHEIAPKPAERAQQDTGVEHEPDRSKPPCLECGAMTQTEAESMCICAGDKDDCHGTELWPDDLPVLHAHPVASQQPAEREKAPLDQLFDLLTRNKMTLRYTYQDDGIHVDVNDEEVFVGFLSEIEYIEEARRELAAREGKANG